MTVDPTLSCRLIDQENRFGANIYQPLDVVCTRADGVYVWDLEGNRYMDFLTAYGAVNQGHNHTRIAAAMVEQCLRLSLTSRAFRNDRHGPFLEKVCTLTGFDRALMMNSGTEAVETAIKAVRRWGCQHKGIPPGKAEIIAFSGNFHGRTTTILSFSDNPIATEGFDPFTPGFQLVPFGDLAAVRAALSPNTCAVLVEPVQGEAGVIVPPKGFMRGLRELCDTHRVMLIADEIQSGLGRTGKLLACQHEGVKADGVALGKSLSGGFYPVSAFLASHELMDVFTPGSHGGTFGGNPLGCAVASVALDVLVEENMVDRAAELGAYFLERLRAMDSRHIKEVRGIGLWAGIEILPEAGGARRFCDALLREGLLCKETHRNTIRLSPPLVITREQLDWAVEKLKVVLEG
jgi:ornithine--oxo-acid transaminase